MRETTERDEYDGPNCEQLSDEAMTSVEGGRRLPDLQGDPITWLPVDPIICYVL